MTMNMTMIRGNGEADCTPSAIKGKSEENVRENISSSDRFLSAFLIGEFPTFPAVNVLS